ncbi:MAG: VIT1/CCC1 transporter family protein [Gallionellaceae bacterium]|nr:VIT1/CCC1 transporter family protein [Gallionellaceae bacterium]MDD5365733.1 VIT1/CCC1 transporter family protein [Gallionellaceae bacterium]
MTNHLLDSWREEKRSAWLYRIVSDVESGTPRQVLFLELAKSAEGQAEIWLAGMARAGMSPPEAYRPDPRTRLVGWLIRRFGIGPMRSVLAAMKVRGMVLYNQPGHATPTRLDQVGERHTVPGGGSLRAAVFGANDGLVSNASLILGVAGASGDPAVVVMSGVAGLLAGAFSMAAGEYVSVRAQREFYEYQIGLEREELDEYPHEEAAELALIYEAKGLSREEAKRLADTLIADPDKALDTLAREELGLNPDELGSPWAAATASFGAFAVGASIPLLPYLLLSAGIALYGAMVASAVSLFGVGATLSLFTGRKSWQGGLRMLLIGAAAGAATWAVGRALGTALG